MKHLWLLAFSVRFVPSEVPRLDTLGLPPVLADIALSPRGMVLVTGVTGSGKSTTLAAMIQHVNENRAVNIVGIEDPVEFVHPDLKAIVAQREVGSDTRPFHDALRHVLRLVPRADGAGRVPAAEVLVNTAAIAERIRQPDPAVGLQELVAEGQVHYGMQTFDQSLMGLYRSGTISYDTAMFYASNPSEFALRASGVAAGGTMRRPV